MGDGNEKDPCLGALYKAFPCAFNGHDVGGVFNA
jgi:hypothetical protein